MSKKEEIGEYQQTVEKQGQKVYKFTRKNIFDLKKGVFRKAWVFCWKEHIDKLGKAGIGLNPAIARMDLSKLLILDKKKGRFYQISDLKRAERYRGRKDLNNSHVWVYPLSCFEEVIVEDQHHIVNSPVPLSRIDCKTSQIKLEEVLV